jgi:KUP system potassium uptake protein
VNGAASGVNLAVEGAFLLANAFKIPDGGWFPLVVGIVILTQLTTWKTGRALVAERSRRQRPPLATFVQGIGAATDGEIVRVRGTAVFLYSQPGITPPSMTTFVRAGGALHQRVFVVSVITDDVPRVHPAQRINVNALGHGVHAVELHYGFMDATTVARDLADQLGLLSETTDFFLGRETVRSTLRPGMARWREILYAFMVRNASDVASYFELPAERVIEIGRRVEI